MTRPHDPATGRDRPPARWTRRGFLAASGAAAAGLLAGCGTGDDGGAGSAAPSGAPAAPSDAPAARPGATAATARGSTGADAAPTAQGPAVEVRHGSRTRPWVALTFHASGRTSFTERMLRQAEDAGVRLTVLAVGTWLEENPGTARRILDRGHELGNHTLRHRHMRELSAADLDREVGGGADVLRRLVGDAGPLFRPSGTTVATPAILAAAGRAGYTTSLGFDVDPADWTEPGEDVVVQRVLSQVRSGSIVSLHMDHEGTVRAFPRIVAGLVERRLLPVPASMLLGAPG